MKNFVRIIPKQGFENWPAKLGKMSSLFHKAEYEMVKQGLRKAATIHVDQNNMKDILERINKHGLIFTPLRKSAHYQGFAHFHHPVKPGDRFYWYGALTRTQKDAEKFKKADIKNDHKAIGQLLGFSKCCCDYFNKTFSKNYDPIWVKLKGKVEGYPECNQMLRYFGARITSHLSCSPKCKATKTMSQKWLAVMKKIDKELTQELYNLLAGEINWNSYHGVVQVETPYFIGVTHTFPYLDKPRVIEWKGISLKGRKKEKRKKKNP